MSLKDNTALDTMMRADVDAIETEVGEPITYFAKGKNNPVGGVRFRGVIQRVPPSGMPEAQGQVRVVHLFLPRSVAATPEVEDTLLIPWRYGGTPATFAVKELGDPDPGGTPVMAEWQSGET